VAKSLFAVLNVTAMIAGVFLKKKNNQQATSASVKNA